MESFVSMIFARISPMKLFALVLTAVLVILAIWMHDSRHYDNEVNEEVGLVTETN